VAEGLEHDEVLRRSAGSAREVARTSSSTGQIAARPASISALRSSSDSRSHARKLAITTSGRGQNAPVAM
jgi:hypothetical protein